MDSSRRSRPRATFIATVTAILLAAGSVVLAGPASADPSPDGQSHSTFGRSHHSTATGSDNGHHQKRSHQGSSAVSLPRPNDFQAQSDPDGALNGGVDQPGGTGGVDLTDQDGNNGSGNDADCEDDNRGVGVPGHCKDRSEAPATETPETLEPIEPELPVDGSPLVLGQSLTLTPLDTAVGLSSAVAPPVTRDVASAAQAAPAAGPTVLPDTGAGQALLSLALGGLLALALGGGLLRRGRRANA
jgi:LPXTG-motif cell wall-anchored protein